MSCDCGSRYARERVYVYVYICEESTTQSIHRLWWFYAACIYIHILIKKLCSSTSSPHFPILRPFVMRTFIRCVVLYVWVFQKKKMMCTYLIHNEFIVFFLRFQQNGRSSSTTSRTFDSVDQCKKIAKKERKNKINIRFQ